MVKSNKLQIINGDKIRRFIHLNLYVIYFSVPLKRKMHFFPKWVNLSFQHKTNLQSFGQWPSLQTTGLSPPTDSSETNGSLLTCFNQYLWKVGTEKQWKSESYAAIEPLKCCICASRMKLLSSNHFYSTPQLQSCRCCWDAVRQRWQGDIKEADKYGKNDAVVPKFVQIQAFFESSQNRLRWQHLSDCSSGPKHFTIFSKNCWTVENHLIRMTLHFFIRRLSFKLWIPLVKENQQLLLVKSKRKCNATALFWG